VVDTSEPDPTENDIVIAKTLQQSYLDYRRPVEAIDVAPVSVVSDSEYGTSFPQLELYIRDEQSEAYLRDVLLRARYFKGFCLFDFLFVALVLFLEIFWVIFLWGPIVGFIAGNRFDIRLVRVYMIYLCCRAIVDFVLIFVLSWFFIFMLFEDFLMIFISSSFSKSLIALSADDIEELKDPRSKVNVSNQLPTYGRSIFL